MTSELLSRMVGMVLRDLKKFSLFLVLLLCNTAIFSAPGISIGLEVLATQHPEMVRGKKIAVLVSKTSIDQSLTHSIDRLAKAAKIKIIFTAENYFRETIPGENPGEKVDAITNAKVIEIKDPLNRPNPNVFEDTELLVVDFQDIGIRYYRYLTILAQFLDLARESSIPVLILDRPNPINSDKVAGPVLEISFRSRFGVYPMPLIYGMTIGELALYFNKVFGLGANLTVIGMEGYQRQMSFQDTGLHWVPPSDHIPEADSPLFYATTGFLGEMGVFSTGVGTTRPFHYILSPWLDGELLAQRLERHKIPGVRFIPVTIKPYYGLYSQKYVNGIEIVVTDKLTYDPFLAGLAILKSLWDLHPSKVPLMNPAASESMDTLLGNSKVRKGILNGTPLMELYATLQPDLASF